MPQRPDFRLYHGNALDVLAGLLAAEVAKPPADGDWLRPDVVLVPQFSMRRWLQQALAESSGICANLVFLTPGEFIDLALDRNLGPAPGADRLAPDTLRWHVLRELQQRPPAALQRFLDEDHPRKAWSLASALADTFEKYQAWRRDWLLGWEHRAPRDDWEATLWRAIGRGKAHRARRIDEYLSRFGASGAEAPSGLPPRLFVFACQNVSPDVLQVIASQSRAGTQHFYLHSPARGFWGDVARWSDYAPSADDAFLSLDDAAPNPLLAAWGQAGRDFVAMLVGGEAVHPAFDVAPFVEPAHATLLGRMQADILDNRAPLLGDASAAWPRKHVDVGDASLQFHACHTRLREVQVLHDQLRALLEAKPVDGNAPLQPRDIAVLAPDIDAYAPHIEAVFGGALGTPRELPYTIADTSPLVSAPIAEAFLRLLELPLRAPSTADVLDLLAVPAIAARFDLEDADRARVQDWLEHAGARWGLDATDRQRHGADGDAFTMEFAIERLLLGYASGADEDIAGIAPWPELEGQAAESLDALLRCMAMLRDARTRLAGPHSPATWATVLQRLLDEAFAPPRDSADAQLLRRLRDAIGRFTEGAAQALYEAPVDHAIVLEHLRTELGTSDARAPFLSGGICFGRMVPMRLIPFRAIWLLGMDAEAFPAREGRDPVNRIANALSTPDRRTGDPSRRDADRYLFLQLFASSGRVFAMSWCGMDPRDNSRREPSTLVTELLDAAAAYHVDAASVRESLVVRHALQPFSPAAYGAPHVGETLPANVDVEVRRFSYDARWRAASNEAAGVDDAPMFAPPTLLLPVREDARGPLTLDRLRRSLMRPHAVYLQEGLGLRLPEDEPPLAEHEPLGKPDALGAYALRHAVFDAWMRASARPDAHALHARLLARAVVAPGADGRAQIAAMLEEIAPFAELALGKGFGDPATRAPFSHVSEAGTLRGTLDEMHRPGLLRVVLRPDGPHGGHVVRHGLDALCASLLGKTTYILSRADKDSEPAWDVRKPATSKRAAATLDALFAWHDAVVRAPQVFLPKSGHSFVACLQKKDAAAALRAARETWTGSTYEGIGRAEASPATRVALRGRDPFYDNDTDAQMRFGQLAVAIFTSLADATPLSLDPA